MNAEGALGRKKDSARVVWDTKPRRGINPKDIEFQTAELVIPNPARDQIRLTSFSPLPTNNGFDKTQMNRLIWGDNLLAMQALIASGYEGKINLIYIDPPFWTGEDYYANLSIGGGQVRKSPSVIERLAYKDIWSSGIDSYLDMLHPRLHLMNRLLADDGAFYVHTDWHVGHYVKVLMDEIFGRENFRNEIAVRRKIKNLQNQFETVRQLNVAFDSILCYAKTPATRLALPRKRREPKSVDQWNNFFNNADRPTLRYPFLGITLKSGQWRWRKEKAEEAAQNYREYLEKYAKEMTLHEYWVKTGSTKRFIKRDEGSTRAYYWIPQKDFSPLDTNWTDIFSYDTSPGSYPTQKSVEILRRVLESGSQPGDLVADFFCGSGTTLVAAESLERKWIGCDFSKVAIQVARNRLVQRDVKPFIIENIGNYQRQLIYLSGARISEILPIVLKLYGATPRNDFPELGTRSVNGTEELVYVSYPDRPVTARKVEELEEMSERLDGRGYDKLIILAWDYEYNFDELLEKRESASKRHWKTEILPKSIPPEVYEYLRKAKSDEDIENLKEKIHFHEKPYLRLLKHTLRQASSNIEVAVGIDRYVIFDYPIEDQEQRLQLESLVKDQPLVLIDYWAVDWNYDGITFKSSWQAMRQMGKEVTTVPKTTSKTLEPGEEYTVAIRVVDVFGNDAAGTVKVDLRG